MFYYDALNAACKSVTGAVQENTALKIRAKCSGGCTLVVRKDGGESMLFDMPASEGVCECEIKLPVGLYFYFFRLGGGLFAECGDDLTARLTYREPKPFQLTVYSAAYRVPSWLEGGVIYQIFPDRFFRSGSGGKIGGGKYLHGNLSEMPHFLPDADGRVLNNDFYGGDLNGITLELPYLKSLSVTAIYLNPIFEAYSNHRYDTGDYYKIDPLLGDEEDFKNLIAAAKKAGIKIILDGVFSHTGDDSVYFNKYKHYGEGGAYNDGNSPYRSWYNFIRYPDKYQCWWGIDTLPEADKTDPGYVDFIAGENGVAAHYARMEIGGWRLDVADELPQEFIEKIRDSVKRVNEEAVIIGEVWEDASNKISYGRRRKYLQGKELDSVMNYPLKDAILAFAITGDADRLMRTVREQIDHYPGFVLHSLMNVLSTHDTARVLSALSGIDVAEKSKEELSRLTLSGEMLVSAKKRLKAASLLQYTLCGVPSLYYGDETGMQGFADPFNRAFFDRKGRDKKLIEWYKFLGKLRKNYPVFRHGEFSEIYRSRGAVVFKRSDENCGVVIAVNVGDDPLYFNFDGVLLDLIGGKSYDSRFELGGGDNAVLIKPE